MTKDELLKWAAKLIDYLHDADGVSPELRGDCHAWFEEDWKIRIRDEFPKEEEP